MDALLEYAGRTIGGGYAIYLGLLAGLTVFGAQLLVLAGLAIAAWRGGLPRSLSALDFVYGFVNPLLYLLVFQPYSAFRPRRPIDVWLDAIGWTMLAAVWAARWLLPRAREASPRLRRVLSRLCATGIVTIAVFAVNDFTRIWLPQWGTRQKQFSLWILCAFGALYVIPVFLLERYRRQLAQPTGVAGFLRLSRPSARRVAVAMAAVAVLTIVASIYRPSDAATRARIAALTPVFADAARRYAVDPRLLAAIVYVTQREQHEPFRDAIERLAMTTFLVDSESHLLLARRFDLSIGVAQVKPVTALTALKVCRDLGVPWDLWSKHLRDVPPLGDAWHLGPEAAAACAPPGTPVPLNKREIVSALLQDEQNIAFAALILSLYQAQWRSARPDWDIASRPEILATLYQIGFARSQPHGSPRSNAFGARVAAVATESWLRDPFDGPRMAMADPISVRGPTSFPSR
jgi:hypothetical protein